MDKVWKRLEDVNVMSVIAYGKKADSKLYYESDFKTQVTQADAKAAFERSMLIINDGTNLLSPISMATNKITTVVNGASAVEATEWTVATN